MKYVQINAYANGWADSIIFKKHRELQAEGHESWVFWARGDHEQDDHMQKIASYPEVCLDVLLTRLDGRAGFHSKRVTHHLLRKLDKIDPDVVHLHILLGYYINIEMLFKWLAAHHCRVLWTLHDCWAFTGHCIHFTKVGCMQWKTRCTQEGCECPQRKEYPKTLAGNTSVGWCFEQKKRLFTTLSTERLELITPSQWLADLVAESFLSEYPICVIHNTINIDIFKPTPSDFRRDYGIGNRVMVLGVASKWTKQKGFEDFVRLANELDKNKFSIVMVGLSNRQIKSLPTNIIGLSKTNNLNELVAIYSTADIFFNPTREDNFPTVNLEAEACGCDVVTYNTGGCCETINRVGSTVVLNYESAVEFINARAPYETGRNI